MGTWGPRTATQTIAERDNQPQAHKIIVTSRTRNIETRAQRIETSNARDLAKRISNRQWLRLEMAVTYRKQTTAPVLTF